MSTQGGGMEIIMNNLKKLCERITENPDNQMKAWQWGQGVALFGLTEVYLKSGDKFCIDYIKNWFDEHLATAYPGRSINTTAPCLSALELYKIYKDEKYLNLCTDFAQWCMAQAPRGEKGAYEHSCTENVYPNQLWADTLFMGALFLGKYSVLTENKMYMYEALRQYRLHYEFLKSPNNSLIVHGYYGNERIQKGVIWGRGNGWFAAGSPIILSIADNSFEDYEIVKTNYINYITDLLKYQNPDGSWNTVIDDENSYPEMTATAAFAYSINEGIKLGFLDSSYQIYADKAFEALEKEIDQDGTLLKASGGTCIMPLKEDYNAIPLCYSPFAQGLAILALNSK